MISELPESIDQTNDPATLYNVLNPVRPAFVSQTEALRNHAEKEVALVFVSFGLHDLKLIYAHLGTNCLTESCYMGGTFTRAINAALEKISILIALRRSSEVPLTGAFASTHPVMDNSYRIA